ncbi:MAG: hypothetical protein QXQ43_04080 [Nitrososphaerota archaeon]
MSDIRLLYKVAQGTGFWGPMWQQLRSSLGSLWSKSLPTGTSRMDILKDILKNPLAQIGLGGAGLAGGAYMLGRHSGAAAERKKPFFRRMFG